MGRKKLDEYSDTGTHWVSLHVNNNDVIYLDTFVLDLLILCLKERP